MALQVQITSVDASESGVIGVSFNIVPSGSYATGGDALDFTKAIQDPSFAGLLAGIISSQGPLSLSVWDAGGNLGTNIVGGVVMGSTLANSKVKFIGATANTELAAGAYPAGITSSKQQGYAIFPKLV